LKKIIWERRGEFVRNFTAEMLAYGLGRELDYYDVRTVTKIAADLEKSDHRFSALVLGIVRSYPFLHRRNADHSAEPEASTVAAAN
jgi:hypothetical protein